MNLHVIQEEIKLRVEATASAREAWPCRKGCDDCCRSLASVPVITLDEWRQIVDHIDRLEPETATAIRERIRNSAGASRPVVCPMLDTKAGTCLVYAARPIACRTYGFYVERESVLGCFRIKLIADQSPDVIWGNAAAVDDKLEPLGPRAELHRWLQG